MTLLHLGQIQGSSGPMQQLLGSFLSISCNSNGLNPALEPFLSVAIAEEISELSEAETSLPCHSCAYVRSFVEIWGVWLNAGPSTPREMYRRRADCNERIVTFSSLDLILQIEETLLAKGEPLAVR